MTLFRYFIGTLFISGLSLPAHALVHHDLSVQIVPALKSLTVIDEISGSNIPQEFTLQKDLQVSVLTRGVELLRKDTPPTETFQTYEIRSSSPPQEIRLQYSGVISDPVVEDQSTGLIAPEGAVLMGSSYWVPQFDSLANYEIKTLSLPVNWKLASPARQLLPQSELFLVAGPFTEYDKSGPVPLKVFLRSADAGLAQKYLDLLPGYADHYSQLIAPYPYESFAVVENFWETGYGMPAFTLLGPTVVRLPYILNSSLPHELLHDWWGNSVYVDYARGNWSEGLTTYMGDHWQQEVAGTDSEYRRNTLMSYQDYARSQSDFPLRQFKGRHSLTTQAVGYGKGLFFFHMLRLKLGDATFFRSLQNFYKTYVTQTVSFEELQKALESTSGQSLGTFFSQWLDRRGAPPVVLAKAELHNSPQGLQVNLQLAQGSPSYELLIPIRWTFANGEVRSQNLNLKESSQNFSFIFAKAPVQVEIDPRFDVFRDLDPRERPLVLSNFFGDDSLRIISAASGTSTQAFAQAWQDGLQRPVPIAGVDELAHLPEQGSLVLLGEHPAFETLMSQMLKSQSFQIVGPQMLLFGKTYSRADNASVIVASRGKLQVLWVRSPWRVEDLAPRLLHYGKFGVLVFTKEANVLKANWPLKESPMIYKF